MVLPLKIRNNYYQPINYIVIVFTCALYCYQSILGVLTGTSITFANTSYKHVIYHNVNYFICTLHFFHLTSHMFKICTSYFTKIVLHFIYKNDCGLFVIEYMEHWNGAVLTYTIDLMCYISKVLKLHALILR